MFIPLPFVIFFGVILGIVVWRLSHVENLLVEFEEELEEIRHPHVDWSY